MNHLRTAECWALLAVTLVAGCQGPAPRAQLVVVVDTDAPVPLQIIDEGADGDISPDATIDTVVIERLDDDGSQICLDEVCVQQLVVPDPASWPLSFGVATPAGKAGTTLHLRVRAFPSSLATSGTFQDNLTGQTADTTDSPTEATIARLVDLVLPDQDVVTERLLLASDCRNTPVSLLGSAHTTCVDDPTKQAAPTEGIEEIPAGEPVGPSRVGTWAFAHAADCAAPPPPNADAVCIYGGFSFIGSTYVMGAEPETYAPAFPPRPVHVSPFYLDRTEVTVGRFRQWVRAGLIDLTPGDPALRSSNPFNFQAECTWLGPEMAANDALPLNCISWQLAQNACQKVAGGSLPSEAQWEHAARGRGQGRLYPWGNQFPACCTASLNLSGAVILTSSCPGSGPEAVGSHPVSAACDNTGDVSRDLVLDLGGNVGELCLDELVSYSEGCWEQPGIFKDPVCTDVAGYHARRGSDWASGLGTSLAALRMGDSISSTTGFRCAYPGGAP